MHGSTIGNLAYGKITFILTYYVVSLEEFKAEPVPELISGNLVTIEAHIHVYN
jgi:hypothetical protein